MTIHSPSLVDEHSTRFLDTRGHCLVDLDLELHAREGRLLYKIIAKNIKVYAKLYLPNRTDASHLDD
jgi:hypothetical protein